jgi:hypothetical protein
MVENIQQQNCGRGFCTKGERQRRTEKVHIGAGSKVESDDPRSDLSIETATCPHFQNNAAGCRPGDCRVELVVVMQIQTAQEPFLANQPCVNGRSFRGVEIDAARQRMRKRLAKP